MKYYVVLEDLDFVWTKDDVNEFECLWVEGWTLEQLTEYFKRSQEEILTLALDRARLGGIKPRAGGLIGEVTNIMIRDTERSSSINCDTSKAKDKVGCLR